ncbi:MAG: TIGR02757 family protein [Myxococcales bacterium]|nr:TIGR02757 family protein [Myxococcales bacterium]
MAQLDPRLGETLERLVRSTDPRARIENDPVGLVRPYARPEDREVAGLVAALLAFGSVQVIRRNVSRVLELLGPSPAEALESKDPRALSRGLRTFRHRVWTGAEVSRLLRNAARLRAEEGSIGAAFKARLERHDLALQPALAELADALRGPAPTRAMAHLVPDPRAGSACKRLHLYLRWMVRPDDGVDLGVFDAPPSVLLVPLDTHVHRIAKNLALTSRETASWAAAEEVTAVFRRFDPEDPVRFDFALCHFGIARQCPSRVDESICGACVMKRVCTIPRAARVR